MKANSIDRVVVSKTNPHNNNALWIDTSNGEKNAVLKYKGNPLVGGPGGGSGCDCGIPTIDKNTQPNIVWRQPTEEDLAKFNSRLILQVADLSEGKLPLFLVMKMTDEGEEYIGTVSVLSVQLPGEGTDGAVNGADNFSVLIAEDWSLLGMLGEG